MQNEGVKETPQLAPVRHWAPSALNSPDMFSFNICSLISKCIQRGCHGKQSSGKNSRVLHCGKTEKEGGRDAGGDMRVLFFSGVLSWDDYVLICSRGAKHVLHVSRRKDDGSHFLSLPCPRAPISSLSRCQTVERDSG